METLVKALRQDFVHLQFMPGETACWSPRFKQITYPANGSSLQSSWSLLHEVGHALLDHSSYESDVELLKKEVAAWNKAVQLAQHYGLAIDDAYMQHCLDTYRDWVHRRSTCPTCSSHGLQPSQALYRCANCQSTWRVSSARFCRSYRLKQA